MDILGLIFHTLLTLFTEFSPSRDNDDILRFTFHA
jgi:hypothetical protein